MSSVHVATPAPSLPSETAVSAAPSEEKIILTPLTSIRFFAALHIFLFHLIGIIAFQGGPPREGTEMVLPEFLRALPGWIVTLWGRGYCSTGLFFLISGFILTYLYVRADGTQSVSSRDFWFARFSRAYPLHIGVMFLVAPVVVGFAGQMIPMTFFGMPIPKSVYIPLTGVLNVALLQSWFPEYALTWNFPTWALSTVVFFYLMFPTLVRWTASMSRATQWRVLSLCPILTLIPSVIYLLLNEKEKNMSFGHELVMRNPLFWLPACYMGMLLARIFNITRYDTAWRRSPASARPSWGDAAAAVLFCLLIIPDTFYASLLGYLGLGNGPRLILRHGGLAPLFLVFIYYLAQEKGLIAKLLSNKLLKGLGDASYSIFIWQFPMMIPGFFLPKTMSPWAKIGLIAVATIIVSLLSVRYIEKPIARKLRKRWMARSPQNAAT
jgi:peptidoglycan/LPS O-acetylase OafA/YrhL